VPLTTGCRTKADQNGACCRGDIELDNALEYTSVPANAFRGCAITSVKGGANVKSIGVYAFKGTGLVSVDLSETQVETIGRAAYDAYTVFTYIKLPSTVKIIGDYAFRNAGLVSVDLSETQVETIGEAAYNYCKALTSIKFPSTVKIIGDSAFYDSGLESVDLSETQVETIGGYAYYSCTALTSIKLPSTVKIIGDGAFANGPCSSSANTLYVPASLALSVYSAVKNSCTVKKYP
jgi:hypothetical protein